jgi:hypothetical protein
MLELHLGKSMFSSLRLTDVTQVFYTGTIGMKLSENFNSEFTERWGRDLSDIFGFMDDYKAHTGHYGIARSPLDGSNILIVHEHNNGGVAETLLQQ